VLLKQKKYKIHCRSTNFVKKLPNSDVTKEALNCTAALLQLTALLTPLVSSGILFCDPKNELSPNLDPALVRFETVKSGTTLLFSNTLKTWCHITVSRDMSTNCTKINNSEYHTQQYDTTAQMPHTEVKNTTRGQFIHCERAKQWLKQNARIKNRDSTPNID